MMIKVVAHCKGGFLFPDVTQEMIRSFGYEVFQTTPEQLEIFQGSSDIPLEACFSSENMKIYNSRGITIEIFDEIKQ